MKGKNERKKSVDSRESLGQEGLEGEQREQWLYTRYKLEWVRRCLVSIREYRRRREAQELMWHREVTPRSSHRPIGCRYFFFFFINTTHVPSGVDSKGVEWQKSEIKWRVTQRPQTTPWTASYTADLLYNYIFSTQQPLAYYSTFFFIIEEKLYKVIIIIKNRRYVRPEGFLS